MPQQVLILGAGALGTALARVIPKERGQVSFWDIDASRCPGGRLPLEQLVPAADWIFLCVSSWAVRTALAPVSALIRPTTAVVSMAKGLESPTGKTMYEVCTEVLPPKQPLAVLGGAMLAHELGTGLPGMGVVACADDAVAANMLALFQGSALQLAWSSDARSVAMSGVLKNIYALALGIGDGLGLGSNARGWLFSQAVKEMLEIGKLLRVDTQVLLSVAGIGDLVATGLSTNSKNHTAGVEIARTGRTGIECEGVMSLPSVIQLVGTRSELRLLTALDGILQKGQNVRIVIQDLLYYRRQ
jgi:glycerol-3-phosphate dehydrogenase (NAD(P)+)